MAQHISLSHALNLRIWTVVALIPAGTVASYGQVADLAGLPRAARRVSRALNQAPAQRQLPWHRVIRSDGRLGFAPGSPEDAEQRARLAAEGVLFSPNGKIPRHNFWQPDLATLLFQLES